MPTIIDLSALGSRGFIIQGDSNFRQAGFSVSSAGDVNGDGFDDIIVGAPYVESEAFLIFGKSAGFGTIDLTFLQADEGVIIRGGRGGDLDLLGFSVSSAGDVNGDGYDDMIIGAPNGAHVGFNTGEAYVIYGKAGGLGRVNADQQRVLDLNALTVADGFLIRGDAAGDKAGYSVSSAGDVNGDGYDDIIVGAPLGDDGGTDAGEAYVIFGRAGARGTVDLIGFAPGTGFVIRGDSAGDQAGFSVSSAGDFNGDGYGDLIVGAPLGDDGGSSAGEAYVIFGKASSFGTIDLTNIQTGASPEDGFVIRGDAEFDQAGYSVSSAGDINGDGYDDLVVGARFGDDGGSGSGEAYVIFGRAESTGVIDLTFLAPGNGFVIQGGFGDQAGISVSSAGDVNGDGYEDIIVGAHADDEGGFSSGSAYVIFGKASGFGTIGLSGLAPADGFVVRGDSAGDQAGFSVSGAGDVNGDGFADLIVGAPLGDDAGPDAGEAYVVFGFGPTESVIRIGSVISQTIRGGVGDDLLDGRDGNDTLIGNGGDDELIGGAGNDNLSGGAGDDDLSGGSGNDSLFGGAGVDQLEGGSGDDLIDGGEGSDLLDAGSGNDIVYGGDGSDTLLGLDGNDLLIGGAGGDSLVGGLGNDIYQVDDALDNLIERVGEGNDQVSASVSYTLTADMHIEALATVNAAKTDAIDLTGNGLNNSIYGNAGANVLNGAGGNDHLVGLEGNDTLIGGAGADNLRGGLGDDIYRVDDSLDAIFELAGQGNDTVACSASYNLTAGASVETLSTTNSAGTGAIDLTGNELNNTIVGNGGNNVLRGDGGNDSLHGLAGNDVLIGGGGADNLRGGAGQDEFRFDTALGGGNIDQILDFSVADDTISLDDAVFAGLALGALSAGAFVIGSAAADADDRIIYNSTTGQLFFDADGAGGAAAMQFATLQAGLALTAADFTVI